MDLQAYLQPQRVLRLHGQTKAAAMDELMDVLGGDDSPDIDRERLAAAVWHREELMSTGIGQGLAIPHVRLAGLKQAVMAVGLRPEGLGDYEALDGQPVTIVVLIAAPQGQHETYIRLLAKIAEVLKHEDCRQAVLTAETTEQAHQILTEWAE